MSGAVLIAGGGTGGHLFPGVAVAQELMARRPGLEVAVVSAGRAMESRLLKEAGLELIALPARALRGAGLVQRLKALTVLPRAVRKARELIKARRPGLVLAVGGYAAFSLGLAAWLSKVPLAVQEQNAAPGLTNRVLSRFARVVFTSFPGMEGQVPAAKVRFTGNPVRLELLQQAGQATAQRGRDGRFIVLILGGSQGAASLNRALMAALEHLGAEKDKLAFIHQTGPKQAEEVEAAYGAAGFQAEVAGFFSAVGQAYGRAHLVICRSGAGTVSELAAVGRASVLVPYPHAAGDHQTLNARAMVSAGAAVLVPDAELTGDKVAGLIRDLMADAPRREAMELAARGLGRPGAASEIAEQCLALMEAA